MPVSLRHHLMRNNQSRHWLNTTGWGAMFLWLRSFRFRIKTANWSLPAFDHGEMPLTKVSMISSDWWMRSGMRIIIFLFVPGDNEQRLWATGTNGNLSARSRDWDCGGKCENLYSCKRWGFLFHSLLKKGYANPNHFLFVHQEQRITNSKWCKVENINSIVLFPCFLPFSFSQRCGGDEGPGPRWQCNGL